MAISNSYVIPHTCSHKQNISTQMEQKNNPHYVSLYSPIKSLMKSNVLDLFMNWGPLQGCISNMFLGRDSHTRILILSWLFLNGRFYSNVFVIIYIYYKVYIHIHIYCKYITHDPLYLGYQIHGKTNISQVSLYRKFTCSSAISPS